MLRQLWGRQTCLSWREDGFWCPAPSVCGKASFHAPQDPCRAFIVLEPWSRKEHGELLGSRRTVVFTLKVYDFICGSHISFLYVKWELCLTLLWVTPVLDAVRVICCFASGRLMELLGSSWFTSSSSHLAVLILTNICGSDLWVHCLLM